MTGRAEMIASIAVGAGIFGLVIMVMYLSARNSLVPRKDGQESIGWVWGMLASIRWVFVVPALYLAIVVWKLSPAGISAGAVVAVLLASVVIWRRHR